MKKHTLAFLLMLLIAVAVSGARAASTIGLNGMGGRVGLVDPENIDATIGVDFVVDMGEITTDVPLEFYVGFWSKSEPVLDFGDQTIRDFVFGSRAKYVFYSTNTALHPFVGAGVNLHIVKFDIPAFEQGQREFPAEEDTELKIGVDVGGGLGIDLSESSMLTGELFYTIVNDVSNLALKLGVIFWLND